MGHTPTLMDYSRFNYVAQPEDKIDVGRSRSRRSVPTTSGRRCGATSRSRARRRRTTRRRRSTSGRAQQDDKPYLRFSTAGSRGADPGELTEAVGDADAVASTTLGMKNLERVADMLLPATTAKPGEPYDDLDELYGRMLGQWALEMNHVAAIVGGFNSQQKHAGQDGVRFTPIAARQAGARRRVPERERVRGRRRGRSTRTSCGASSRSACSTASGRASSACSTRC